MKTTILKTMMAVAAFALVTGCATTLAPTQANLAIAGSEPDRAQCTDLLWQYFRLRLKDPDSVKDVAYGQPVLLRIPIAGRPAIWRIPFVYNAKNSFGAYVGLRSGFLFETNGQIDWQQQQTVDGLQEIVDNLNNR